MASLIDLYYTLAVTDSEGIGQIGARGKRRWAPGTGQGKRETVTLNASSFTALSPPANSKAVIILLGTAVSLTLKGITSDTGVVLTPTTGPLGIDLIIPISSPSIGIHNGSGSSQTVECIWL